MLSHSAALLICYANDWYLMHNQFSVTQMVCWQQTECCKITLRWTVWVGFTWMKETNWVFFLTTDQNHSTSPAAEFKFDYKWGIQLQKSHLSCVGRHTQTHTHWALWALHEQRTVAEMTEQVQNKPAWIRRSWLNQAGHLSKIFRFGVNLAKAGAVSKVPIELSWFLKNKEKKKNKRKKSLINSTKQICSADQSQPFRIACWWGPCNKSHPLASQAAGSHGNLEMEASKVGVVGGIKWRRKRTLLLTRYYSNLT